MLSGRPSAQLCSSVQGPGYLDDLAVLWKYNYRMGLVGSMVLWRLLAFSCLHVCMILDLII